MFLSGKFKLVLPSMELIAVQVIKGGTCSAISGDLGHLCRTNKCDTVHMTDLCYSIVAAES